MMTIIALFLAGVSILGLLLLIAPAILLDPLHDVAGKPAVRLVAVALRAVLGVAFILVAEETRYPNLITIIGALALVAALVIAVMPKESFADLMSWASDFSPWAARLGGGLALIAVGFLAGTIL